MRKPTIYIMRKKRCRFAVTAKLISAFVFATQIVHLLYFLNPTFPASSHLLCMYRSVCVGPVRKPHCRFSHEAAHFTSDLSSSKPANEFPCYKKCKNKVCDVTRYHMRQMSRLMGKPTICLGENKDADQLRGNREADQRLCFRYSDSTIPLLLKSEISSF